MSAALKIPHRTAFQQDLFKIEGSWSSLNGVSSLPTSIRPWVYWFVALIKCGYIRIQAPIWSITEAHMRSCSRTTGSERSTYRALRWLCDNGYIDRRQLRIGSDVKGVIIDINIDRFNFFLFPRKEKEPGSIVVKGMDTCDSRPHLPSCQGDIVTSKTTQYNKDSSKVCNKRIISKDCAKTHANAVEKNTRHKYHPIVYTLMRVFEHEPQKKWKYVNLAKAQLSNQVPRTVDWEYWESRWSEMPHSQREHSARKDIIPCLDRKSQFLTQQKPSKPSKSIETIHKNDQDWQPPFSLQELIDGICGKKPNLKKDEPPPIPTAVNEKPKENQSFDSLSREDLEILIAANKKLFWHRKNHCC